MKAQVGKLNANAIAMCGCAYRELPLELRRVVIRNSSRVARSLRREYQQLIK